MTDSSRYKDLILTIEKQNAELSRYKTRLKDLVAAHKCLLKEKEVLESSLQALSKTSSRSNDDGSTDKARGSSDCDEVSSEDNESTDQLRSQLTTLMNSLATLSEEKSRMEAGFQADKKQLRAEKLELEKTIKELQSRLEHETRAHLSEMENFKSKLIIERHQREKEHNDHGVMIRELQKVVTEERSKRERTEDRLEALRSELEAARSEAGQLKREAADRQTELEAARLRLREGTESGEETAAAARLRQELALLREQLYRSAAGEQRKLEEAEKRSRELAASHEERVATLEGRLAELSLTVGQYDRLRQTDLEAIARLRERIAQLETERSTGGSSGADEKADFSLDTLSARIKQILEDACNISEKPLDIKAVLMECVPDSNLFLESHRICQEEYDSLKAEYDSYKKSHQMMQQNDSQSYRTVSNNGEEFRSQIKKLKSRIRELHSQLETNEVQYKKDIEALQANLLEERKSSREKLSQTEAEWRGRLASVESQLARQRQRAMEVLAERDRELVEIRASLLPSSISSDKPGEEAPLVLHYSEEVSRREVELTRLRKEKHRLEGLLRESQRSVDLLNIKIDALNQALRIQMDRFEQCQSREGANLEYLKNVVLSFLLTSDPASRSHMLNAISAVLQFTDSEKGKVSRQTWWQTSQV